MVVLSDSQFASLLEEIAAAMRVGTPIVDSMQRLKTHRLGRVAGAAGQIAEGLERGESISTAVGAVTAGTHKYVVAAIRAAEQSGDAGLIERMANLLKQRSELSRDTRFAWFYPGLLALVGYAVGVGVMAPMIRRLDGRDVHWPDSVLATANWLESNGWLPLVLLVFLLMVVMIWPVSRRRFPRSARDWLFCTALADQVVHDVPEEMAIRTAAEMSGQLEVLAVDSPSLDSPAVARIVSVSNPTPEGSPFLANEKQALIARLRYLASIYGDRARVQSILWSRWLPRISMVVIGCGIILSYAWWVIAPVYTQVAQW